MITHCLRGMVALALGMVFITAPAAASTPSLPAAVSAQCLLEPGTYAIMNSRGEFVGILIVYPDCRMEVYKAKDLV